MEYAKRISYRVGGNKSKTTNRKQKTINKKTKKSGIGQRERERDGERKLSNGN